MRYRTVTRGMTLLVMAVGLLGLLAGWALSACENGAAETAAEMKKQVPIYFVETDEKKLAISFDAAWGCERTENILEILKKYDVKATFFLTNIWLDDYPEMAKKIADDGHEIAMHSVSHPHMSQISREEAIKEIDGNYQKIVETTGYQPILFRFPFGDYDDKTVELLQEKEYYGIQWSIDSLDWCESKTKEEIVSRVTAGLHPGAIILCHNNGVYTAQAIDEIIPYAQSKGYQFVPVGELIYKGNYTVNQQGMQEMPQTAVKMKNTASESG